MKIAVIPAAGKGTRFHELGSNYAKTLLPFDGVPILERIIDSLSSDFDEIRTKKTQRHKLFDEKFSNERNKRKVPEKFEKLSKKNRKILK